jgi:hypothetical protein
MNIMERADGRGTGENVIIVKGIFFKLVLQLR